MATYLERYNLLNSATMRARLLMACVDAALAIANEAAGTPNHANRLQWAEGVLMSRAAAAVAVERALWDVTRQAAVTAAGEAVSDSDLFAAVSGLLSQSAAVARWIEE